MSDLHRGPTRGSNLLDELESLKQLLNDSGTLFLDDAPSIPVLRDVVSPGSAPLLDLDEIFDERLLEDEDEPFDPEDEPHFPDTAEIVDQAAEPEAVGAQRWDRDLLIQEVVDEFVPRIEAALRERLRHIDDATLRAWLRRD